MQIRPVTIAIPAPPCTDCEEPGAARRPGEATGGSNAIDPAVALTGAAEDQVILSDAARRRAAESRGRTELAPEEEKEVRELRKRDREVRAHEQAHLAAAGRHAQGGARYETTTGPDGREYATSGEVSIDASPVPGDPEATLQKAAEVRRAALAPADPSAQDLKIAARASQMAAEARAELARETTGTEDGTEPGAGPAPPDPTGPGADAPTVNGAPDDEAPLAPHPLAARFSPGSTGSGGAIGSTATGTDGSTGSSGAIGTGASRASWDASPHASDHGDAPAGSLLLGSSPTVAGRRIDVTT